MTRQLLAFAVFWSYIVAVPYSEYILAPDTRSLAPVAVHSINGTIDNPGGVTTGGSGSATFEGPSWAVYDYGKNIGGVVSITVGNVSTSDATIALAFTESTLFLSTTGSDSLKDGGPSYLLRLLVGDGPGTYTVSRDHEFGAFRYLTLVSNTSASVEVVSVQTNFTAALVNDLTGYTGYFHCEDELLNRIWYAGAYTNQLCTIDPNHGDAFDGGHAVDGQYTWSLNVTVTNGSTALVDGAKRDRVVWPGDMVVSIPAIAVSTYDMESPLNSIQSLLNAQGSNGMLPYYGVTYNTAVHTYASFTYHLHNLIDLFYYVLWSGDKSYLLSNWSRVTTGLAWSLSYIDSSGLMNVTSSLDWGRENMGGHNIEANAILFYVLNLAIEAGRLLEETDSVSAWKTAADTLKNAANELLWSSTEGLYKDDEDSLIYPQDGNAWAVKANLTITNAQNEAISAALEKRWLEYGAPAPEAVDIISPFISGFESEAHLLSGNATRALELIRLQWGYMLDNEYMTNSTFIEGYSTSGLISYSPYHTMSRISHAHGWSTAPTTLLSTYVAGLHVDSLSGQTWHIAPQIGDLEAIEAGYATSLGNFNITIDADGAGYISSLTFCTPKSTSGYFELKGQHGILYGESSSVSFKSISGELAGGCWYYKGI